MSDRRRSSRFICRSPVDAAARVSFDGVVESWHSDRVIVTSAHGAVRGDEFVMQIRAASGVVTTWAVGVLACDPPVGTAAASYRMTLMASPVSPPWDDHDMPAA